jgi:hypothetical protein
LRTPKGFRELDVRVWTDGKTLVIEGEPPDEDADPRAEIHHCDVMGCGWCHVLARLPIDEATAKQLDAVSLTPAGSPPQ